MKRTRMVNFCVLDSRLTTLGNDSGGQALGNDRKSVFLIIGIVFIALKGLAFSANQCSPTFEPPVAGATITSDYGPRKVKGKWDFHEGIDFAAAKGSTITAVQGGKITAIRWDGDGGGWVIDIELIDTTTGKKRKWSYLHTFEGNENGPFPIEVGGFKLDKKPSGGYKIIRPGLKDLEENMTVKPGEPIAPVGDSGGVPPHVDLRLNAGADNPFCFVKSPAPASYDLFIFSPEREVKICPPEPVKLTIKVGIDSRPSLDLDKVEILVDGGFVGIFRFGGQPGQGHSGNNVKEENGAMVGGYLQKVNPLDNGLDEFIIENYDFGSSPKDFKIEAKAYKVSDPDTPVKEQPQTFSIKAKPDTECTPPPPISRPPWQPEEPIEFASQKEGCFALGFASIHDFPYCMYEETAMNVGPTCSAGLFCCPEVRALAEAVSRPLVWDVPRCFADGLDSEWSPVVKKYAALWWKYHKWRYVINLQPDCTNCPNSHLGNFPHDHVRKTATLEMALYKPSTETHEELATITGSVISSGGKITKIEYRVDKSTYWIAAATSIQSSPSASSADKSPSPQSGEGTNAVEFFFKLPNEIFVV